MPFKSSCIDKLIILSVFVQALLQACLGAYMSETDSFKDEPEVINLVDDESDDGKRKKQKKRGHSRLVRIKSHQKQNC